MIYHWFQNSVWKVVKIAKTSNLKSAVKSQSITTVHNFTQCVERILNKIALPVNKTYAGLKSMLQRFRIYFA